MWPWKKVRKSPRIAPETLEERLDALEGSFRGLKAEWLDTYDKLYRLAGRLDAGRRWEAEKKPPGTPGAPEIAAQEAAGEEMLPVQTLEPANGGPKTRRDLLSSLVGG